VDTSFSFFHIYHTSQLQTTMLSCVIDLRFSANTTTTICGSLARAMQASMSPCELIRSSMGRPASYSLYLITPWGVLDNRPDMTMKERLTGLMLGNPVINCPN